MVDLVTALALLLLAGGVAGSVLPLVPAGLLSLSGIYLYHVTAGPAADLGLLPLVGFTLVGALTVAVEHLGGAVASKAGGADASTAAAAAFASLALFVVLGPLGVVVGTAVVVLAAELRAGAEFDAAVRAATWTLGGVLASSAAQFGLTLSMLVGFLLLVPVFG